MIAGRVVNLIPVEREHLPLFVRWQNDPEFTRFWGRPGNTTSLAEMESWFQEQTRRRGGKERFWVIATKEGKPLGRIWLFGLNHMERNCEVAIGVGEKEYWGEGYGSDAMMAFLNYLFTEMGLHKVYLNVLDFNQRAMKSYLKCGFVVEGTLREEWLVEGKWCDYIRMGILEHEFKGYQPVFPP